MSKPHVTSIAQLVCSADTRVNFARLVGDLDTVLARFGDTRPLLTWDCDDVAIFDLPGTRILLGWAEAFRPDGAGCLTLSAGPSPMPPRPGQTADADALCVRLVERVQSRLAPLAVIWSQEDGIITGEVVDRLIDALPQSDHLPVVAPTTMRATDPVKTAAEEAEVVAETAAEMDSPLEVALQIAASAPVQATPLVLEQPLRPAAETLAAAAGLKVVTGGRSGSAFAEAGRARANLSLSNALRKSADQRRAIQARATVPPAVPAANDRPALPRWTDPELTPLREALYAPQDAVQSERPTTQMRLAVHAMNATLIVVYAPLGAAVMTYSLLKGEDMRVSARMLMLAGSLSMMLKTPIGQGLFSRVTGA